MTIQTFQVLWINNSNRMSPIWFNLKESLKSIGWTVSGSSDGSTADTSDNWPTETSINGSNRWMVLKTPPGAADPIEIGLGAIASNLEFGQISFYPRGDASGFGSVSALPTGTNKTNMISGGAGGAEIVSGVTEHQFTLLADDADPYGWALITHTPGAPASAQFAMGLIPLEGKLPGDVGIPYAVYSGPITSGWLYTSTDNRIATGTVTSHFLAEINDGTSCAGGGTAIGNVNASTPQTVRGTGLSPNLKIVLPQTPFYSVTNGQYLGRSSFMRQMGVQKVNLDVLKLVVDRDKIVLGDFAFNWDGSVPVL